MAAEGPGDLPVPDLRTMEELCQPSLNYRGSIKVNGVTNDALRLYLFPYSLTHHSTTWFDRLPRNSINTFEQMAKMFLEKYFPPSMVTKLRNEITNFLQRPDESLFKAWECYKLSVNRCPNHNMLPVTQIDTFYNGLTLRHRDTINAAAGGTFMKRPLKGEMAKININLIRVLQDNQQVEAVIPNCETCGGPHSFNDCPATVGNTQNVYAAGAYQGKSYRPQGNRNLLSYRSDNYLGPPGRYQFFQGASHGQNPPPAYQAPVYQAPIYQASVHQSQIPQPQVVTTNEFTNFMKVNDAILKNMQTNMTSLTNLDLELKNIFGQFMKMNTASSSGSGTLPDVQPPVVQTESPILNSEPIVAPIIEPVDAPVSAPKPNQRPSIPYPSRLHDQKLRDKANDQREKFFQIFKDLNFNISFADALILMPKFGPTIKTLLTNKDKLSELARTPLNEHCSAVLLKKLPEKLGDPDKVAEDVFVKVRTFHFPTDFIVVDFDADPRVPLILGRSFLKTERALIDVFEGTCGMAIDYCILNEGMPILRGRKSVPGISNSDRENGKNVLLRLHVNYMIKSLYELLVHDLRMSILRGRKSVPGLSSIKREKWKERHYSVFT
nr:hypothetical protein [Tanacetum cinerariifolium]